MMHDTVANCTVTIVFALYRHYLMLTVLERERHQWRQCCSKWRKLSSFVSECEMFLHTIEVEHAGRHSTPTTRSAVLDVYITW